MITISLNADSLMDKWEEVRPRQTASAASVSHARASLCEAGVTGIQRQDEAGRTDDDEFGQNGEDVL